MEELERLVDAPNWNLVLHREKENRIRGTRSDNKPLRPEVPLLPLKVLPFDPHHRHGEMTFDFVL